MNNVIMAIGSSEIGGGQKVFVSCIKELLKRNMAVIVLLPDGPLVDVVRPLNVKIYTVNFSSITSVIKIAKILKKERCDIINAYLTKCCWLVSLANMIYGIPICCTLLNAITYEKLGHVKRCVYPYLYYLLQKLCDGIIVNSEQNRKHFIEVANMDGDRIKVIYSGIDIEEFVKYKFEKIEKNKFVIGSVGRLSPEKGHIYLLRALTYLHNIEYECLIVGDGPLRTELEKFVIENGLADYVKFVGFQENVVPAMSIMDVVVIPSLNETFGIAIIEAFALRKTVIASNVGGIPELINDFDTGLLFKSTDSKLLAEKIFYTYNNRDVVSKIGGNAYKYCERKFSTQIMADNTVKYYNDIVRATSYRK